MPCTLQTLHGVINVNLRSMRLMKSNAPFLIGVGDIQSRRWGHRMTTRRVFKLLVTRTDPTRGHRAGVALRAQNTVAEIEISLW